MESSYYRNPHLLPLPYPLPLPSQLRETNANRMEGRVQDRF